MEDRVETGIDPRGSLQIRPRQDLEQWPSQILSVGTDFTNLDFNGWELWTAVGAIPDH